MSIPPHQLSAKKQSKCVSCSGWGTTASFCPQGGLQGTHRWELGLPVQKGEEQAGQTWF